MTSELVTARHLGRKAVIYIRQSTPQQMLSNQESLRLQYALQERAQDLGWRATDIEVIGSDLGRSRSTAEQRQGFKVRIPRVVGSRSTRSWARIPHHRGRADLPTR